MGSLTQWLFNPSGLTPHGFCLLWNPGLIWLHALSDAGVAVAYFSIPFTLAAIIRQRPDLVFRPVVALSAAFILFCGIGHLLDVITLWLPAYGVEGLVKAATAAISIVTAIALRHLMPQILALPSPAQLRKADADLHAVREAECRTAMIAQEAASARDALAEELVRRQAAEKRMAETDQRFQLLLQSNVAEALSLLDADGNIETWNVASERVKGYKAEEIIGRNFASLFTPEDLVQGVPARLLSRARDIGRFSAEASLVRKDGERFLARISIDAIRRPNGTLRGFLKWTQDITDSRIEAEQRTRIFELAPNGMMIIDETGTITVANLQAGHIFGHAGLSLVGRTVDDLIAFEATGTRDSLRAAFIPNLDCPGTSAQKAFTLVREDGSKVMIEVMVSAVKTPRGQIVIASLSDVSERMQHEAVREAAERRGREAAEATNAELDRLSRHLSMARDRAEEASQAKSRFLAGITHELRTPLHGILGYAELLTLEGGLTPAQSKRLETMIAAGQHLLGMVNAVLDMSQIEADRTEMQLADVDVADLAGVCMNVVRPAAEARGIALGEPPAGQFHVIADPTRLRQVLINLLGNAVKFAPAGQVDLRMRASADGDRVRIEIVDTGPGIPPVYREKLFISFERLNAESVSGIEGSGLGLAISAKLVQLMGGQIGHEDNPAGGSVFWVEVPCCTLGSAACPDLGQPAVQAAGPRLRVLVVDDESMNRTIASSFLTRAGHEAVCADSGIAAIDAAAGADFDIILMDVRMPGMNGMDATRLIRALPGPRGQVHILAVTAHAFAEQVAMCREAGMDGHLSKPFTQAILLGALQKAAGQKDGAAGSSAAAICADLPMFDSRTFLDAIEGMSAADASRQAQAVISRCEAMLDLLRSSDVLDQTDRLADEAHRVAGSVGMFGLFAVSDAARILERAAETGSRDLPALMVALDATLVASVGEFRQALEAAG